MGAVLDMERKELKVKLPGNNIKTFRIDEERPFKVTMIKINEIEKNVGIMKKSGRKRCRSCPYSLTIP